MMQHRGVRKSRWLFGTLTTLILCYSLYVGYQGWGVRVPKEGQWPWIKIEQLVLLVGWSLLPPVWLFFEYFFEYLREWEPNTQPPPDFDIFKHGQDLAAKMWIAVSSVLLVLYFGKDIKL
ncbi:MAG: hypothetical protein WAN65_14460 [Candidatus Sulfotelmatobacter sp.]